MPYLWSEHADQPPYQRFPEALDGPGFSDEVQGIQAWMEQAERLPAMPLQRIGAAARPLSELLQRIEDDAVAGRWRTVEQSLRHVKTGCRRLTDFIDRQMQ